jgi:hypothetical protein
MAITAKLIRIITWLGNQISMGNGFVIRLLAKMAGLAGDLAMNGCQESFFVHKYFFPGLQRSHFSPSTLS